MQEPSAVAAKAQVFPEAEQQQLRCPRCDSTNTKFCYYNNYNLSQPRHFCKSCRRYWTHGGTLRNIPIGGASRKPKPKSKRSSPSSPTSPSPVPKRPNSREPSSILCPPATEERQLLEVNGSLGSLLASERQFENLMHGFQFPSDGFDVMGLPKSSNTSDQYHLQSSNGSSGTEGENPTEDLLGLLGDSNCWANWWPDLTIE